MMKGCGLDSRLAQDIDWVMKPRLHKILQTS
jgi:hypothetical protein